MNNLLIYYSSIRNCLLIFAASSILMGCVSTYKPSVATTEAKPYRSAIDQANSTCLASIGIGAIVGAIIGNNTGSRNATKGAATGAALGTLTCAFLVNRATKQDKARIREHEEAALNAPETGASTSSFISDGGERVIVKTTTQNASIPELYRGNKASNHATTAEAHSGKTYTVCRTTNTEVSVENDQRNIGGGYQCRTPEGDWETVG